MKTRVSIEAKNIETRNIEAEKQKAKKLVKGIRIPKQILSSLLEPKFSIYTIYSKSYTLRKRKYLVINFEAPISALISNTYSFLKNTPKL